MFNNFTKHWKNLEQKGIITNEEFVNATFTQHYRTVEEFRNLLMTLIQKYQNLD